VLLELVGFPLWQSSWSSLVAVVVVVVVPVLVVIVLVLLEKALVEGLVLNLN
jgi:hypothetical protein